MFTDAYGARPWVILTVPFVIVFGILAILWAVLPNHGGCAQGFHAIITGYMPILIGKIVTVVPLTTCVAN